MKFAALFVSLCYAGTVTHSFDRFWRDVSGFVTKVTGSKGSWTMFVKRVQVSIDKKFIEADSKIQILIDEASKSEKRLQELGEEIESLKKEMDKANEQVKAELQVKMDKLSAEFNSAKTRFDFHAEAAERVFFKNVNVEGLIKDSKEVAGDALKGIESQKKKFEAEFLQTYKELARAKKALELEMVKSKKEAKELIEKYIKELEAQQEEIVELLRKMDGQLQISKNMELVAEQLGKMKDDASTALEAQKKELGVLTEMIGNAATDIFDGVTKYHREEVPKALKEVETEVDAAMQKAGVTKQHLEGAAVGALAAFGISVVAFVAHENPRSE